MKEREERKREWDATPVRAEGAYFERRLARIGKGEAAHRLARQPRILHEMSGADPAQLRDCGRISLKGHLGLALHLIRGQNALCATWHIRALREIRSANRGSCYRTFRPRAARTRVGARTGCCSSSGCWLKG
eukprot:scaffold291728_cov28-Tisochrysis_lutea.AAC.2